MTTVVLADDHEVVRRGLRLLLESEPGIRIIGETGDGLEAVRLVERLSPHVLVVDLLMPGLGGLEVTRQVSRRCPQTRVVVLSMHESEVYVLEALRNGAVGYVLKGASAADLIEAVREAARGGRYLSRSLSKHALDLYAQKAQESPPDAYETLTTREREVLHLVLEGYTSGQVGVRLGISGRTVETHRGHLMQKLGLRTQADLVRFAVERGLLTPGSKRPREQDGQPAQ